ncbi:M20/M25/M40 family metallo-hydrolase [Amnibacterium flavum]|uniref:Peptidase M20 dimerisation domain-containing protein n=1 Tax=Amnibacterium flavum TaxID=2173173 RepID=A0A2V1HWD3_9MICO|nr:M20/M25/M40 family metallo-hydrolase [Amnibacterium flavum]PVZ96182.1 hypothetical protein DDQ50_07075 [Amnibacterium flavum]
MNDTIPARPGVAERLSRMIQLPTVSAEAAERGPEPFRAFRDLLAELYPLAAAALEFEQVTELGLLYRWRGTDPSADPLVLMAHFDVVPADTSDAWTHPPFAGVIDDGYVHGRGTLDDKGPLLVVIEAVENLISEGFSPARDVYLSFGGDEEVGGTAAQAISSLLRERGITPWFVLDEGGAVVDAPLPGVGGTTAMVGVGEKGTLDLLLSARGEGGHASAPPSVTAVGRLARAVTRLTPTTFAARTPSAISDMLRLLSEKATGGRRLLYRTLSSVPPVAARVFAAMGGEPAALVRTTIAPTMQSGGIASNVLPSQASVTLNLRIALGETIDGTIARVRDRIHDPLVDVAFLHGDDPSPESRTDNEQFALLREAVTASYPDATTVPYVMMAATDSRYFHRFSPAVYRFAPLAMSVAQRGSIHGVDERVEIAALERGEVFHRTLIRAATRRTGAGR